MIGELIFFRDADDVVRVRVNDEYGSAVNSCWDFSAEADCRFWAKRYYPKYTIVIDTDFPVDN